MLRHKTDDQGTVFDYHPHAEIRIVVRVPEVDEDAALLAFMDVVRPGWERRFRRGERARQAGNRIVRCLESPNDVILMYELPFGTDTPLLALDRGLESLRGLLEHAEAT